MAVVYLSVGVGILTSPSYYQAGIKELLSSTTYLFLGGWIATSLGVVLVQYHNIWVNDWRTLITVVAWVVVIKGVLLLALPTFTTAFDWWFTKKGLRNYIMPMVFIMGFIFAWFGFFA